MEAVAYQTDIPGLFDLVFSDGKTLHDMTHGQLAYLVMIRGWEIRFA